jgi:RND family efflux transporter MFP subunit
MARFPWARLRRPLPVVCGVLVMAAMLAWLMGAFHHRIPPGPPAPAMQHAPAGARHRVQLVRAPQSESAVGTVRAVHETAVASRILARIKTLNVARAGQPVQRDEVLVELESSDLQAALEQANAAVKAAVTRRDKAKLDLERTEHLAQQGIASPDRLDTDRVNWQAAQAEVERSQQAVAGATSALQFATIKAPMTGIVVDKRVNQGDVVQPGQVICTLYDPTHLQLVATVREELAGRLKIGQPVEVTLDALGKQCQGSVAEIVPDAEARTRSFQVKVTGPCQPGIVTGMFGRLHVPVDDRQELQVPLGAVRSVGQLDFVYVVAADDSMARRFVRTGQSHGAMVEVLAGLQEGEVVLQDAAFR